MATEPFGSDLSFEGNILPIGVIQSSVDFDFQ
jgi:hypothetical protein